VIWLIIVAVVFVAGGAWLIAKSLRTRLIVAAAGLAAVSGYWLTGKPDMHDEPLSGRLDALERVAETKPESLTGSQLMSLAQKRAHDEPKSPMPHWIMGEILEASGRPEEAVMAFESALRRDPRHLPTIKDLADLRFKLTGDIDPATTELYHEVFAAEPNNLRAGYMAGIGDWRQGKKDEAKAEWAAIAASPAMDDTHRQMFSAMRQMFGIDPAPAEALQTPASPAK
jgi:cytochrome c-type biogenesis protein CcmH/NrfG